MADNDNKEPGFEEYLLKLENCAETLCDAALPLEDAIKTYEKGAEYYSICEKILDSAKQRIEEIGNEGAKYD